MTDDQTSRPDGSQGSDGVDPVGSSTGESTGTTQTTEAPLDTLPETLAGKSPQEIAKMYVSLEKKLGEQSSEVESARRIKEDTETMLRAIWSDPDTYRQVESAIKRYTSGETLPEVKPPAQGDEEESGDGEVKKSKEVDPGISDLRKAEENRVLNDFFAKFGYNNLDDKARKDRYAQLSVSLAELVDPGGKKPLKEILTSIPLDRLPKYLENAHFIAFKNDLIAQGKRSAMLSQQENEAASIGSFASSSGKKSDSVTLSNREREVAQRMGISEEKYAKRKAEIQKEATRFE